MDIYIVYIVYISILLYVYRKNESRLPIAENGAIGAVENVTRDNLCG